MNYRRTRHAPLNLLFLRFFNQKNRMNHALLNLITTYATRDHAEVRACLLGMSKDLHIAVTTDLLTAYFNDKNSSTLREWVTATLCGYQHQPRKLGYNGYRHDSFGNIQHCEVKPQNCDTSSGGDSYRTLNGSGNFNGYTHKRFKKDQRENPALLISGFVDGRLVYILEVPFNTPGIVKTIAKKMDHFLPDGDKTSHYVIGGANFAFADYKDSPDLKIRYVEPLEKLEERANTRPLTTTLTLLNFLRERAYPGQSRLFQKKM